MISLVHTVAIVAALVSVGVYGSQNVFEGRYPKHLQALELLQLQKLVVDSSRTDICQFDQHYACCLRCLVYDSGCLGIESFVQLRLTE